MFDIGWSEMAVIALLTLIVIGPRELPKVLRTVGQWVRKAQSLAREFQRGLDDMAREADLEDAKKLVDAGRSIANPKKMVMDTLDPTGSVEDAARDVQSSITAEAPSTESGGKTPEGAAEPSNAADGEDAEATVVKGPVEAAPPDSITPPPAAGPKSKAKPKAKATTKTDAKSASKPKLKAKPKPRARPKAEPKPAAAGSNGSQKPA